MLKAQSIEELRAKYSAAGSRNARFNAITLAAHARKQQAYNLRVKGLGADGMRWAVCEVDGELCLLVNQIGQQEVFPISRVLLDPHPSKELPCAKNPWVETSK
jgi:hypothetical protein